MSKIFTLILALATIYLSSCTSSGGNNATLIPTPVVDSESKGGYVQASLTNSLGGSESFTINDYTLNGRPGYSLYATVAYNHTDSLWHLNLQAIDQKLSRIAFIYTATNTSALGTYTSVANNATFTDYSNGQTITYAILAGSTVDITQSSYPIQGSFNFNLNYNYFNTVASGSFSIFH